ncbi:MAG: ABC transporter substrate-binding protein [Hyphomicrobiales bacterium]|nr:ABC transporter substrate-binding protein [Hyphomicrobiales bacterium]
MKAFGVFGAIMMSTTSMIAAQEPIIIGFATAQSGWLSYESSSVEAAKIAIEEINSAGGLLGRQIKIVEADTKTDRTEGARAGQEMVDQGAKLVVVSCDYDMGSPAAFAAESAGVIAISLCANDPKMGVQGVGSHAFSWSFAAQSGGYVLADFGYEEGWRKAYSLLDTTIEFDKSTCAGFNARWKELVGEEGFLGEDTWRNDDPSISAQITRLLALPQQPDVIMLCTYLPGGASAIKQLRDAGIKTPLITSQALDGDFWLGSVPNLSGFYYNAYMSIFGDEPSPESQALLDKYMKRTGQRPVTSNFVTGYGLIKGYALAVERAGTDETDAVLAEFNKFTDEKIVGVPITFTPEMHIQLKWPALMMAVENGKHKAIRYQTSGATPSMSLLFPQ